jgi:cell division protein FtsL
MNRNGICAAQSWQGQRQERFAVTQAAKESQRRQRGAGKLKAIIYTAILVAGVFVAFKIVPLYVANYQLKDKMAEQARFAVVNRYSDEQIRDVIFKTVQDLDIPAKREDIKVEHTNHGLRISLNYTTPVDFMVYQTDWNFAPASEAVDIMK